MSVVKQLKKCSSLRDLAHILGYQPKALSYIIYKLPTDHRYSNFEIPKKSGGRRSIAAPCKHLKALQRRLADLLYQYIEELKPADEKIETLIGSEHVQPLRKRARKSISHGYEIGLSIATNAEMHIKKKYVFNIDLKDFFPSINFGRVRGFFIKDKNFRLNSKVATIMAQIACHNNQLPQGSPCSPVISNLIVKQLDYALVKLAKRTNCTYTRYVDDLTFSFNGDSFPKEIAEAIHPIFTKKYWRLGQEAKIIIEKAGLSVNVKKCRMQENIDRQEVTGLVVNRKVNISSNYYREVRAMCNSMFTRGFFHQPHSITKNPQKKKLSLVTKIKSLFKLGWLTKEAPIINSSVDSCNSIRKLHGMVAFVYHIKSYQNRFSNSGYRISRHDGIRKKSNDKYPPLDRCANYSNETHIVAFDGIKNLYKKFLMFKYFYYLDKPLIVCEGKTDNLYLKCAIEMLKNKYPALYDADEEQFRVSFFNRTELNSEILCMAEGTSGLIYLLSIYKRFFSKYLCDGKRHPVIIIVDDDDAGRGVSQKAQKMNSEVRALKKITKKSLSSYVFENLYLVKVPSAGAKDTPIESLFTGDVLNTELGGKKFNPENSKIDISKEYGKDIFSKYVVIKNKQKINFNGFSSLLDEVQNIIKLYNKADAY